MFNKYYQDELAFLRESGREFSAAHPELGNWLAEPGTDPDVERLLEGFAFLTGRIREKLDDELPEFTESLIEMFWPDYLRPTPSFTILQCTAQPKAQGKAVPVPRGTRIDSVPVDGTRCGFRTTQSMTLQPLRVVEVEVGESPRPFLRLRFSGSGAALTSGRVRLHLTGDVPAARGLFLSLCRHVQQAEVRSLRGSEEAIRLDGFRIEPAGLGEDAALLPGARRAFQGHRLLREYFAFPAKFMFVELEGLAEMGDLGRESQFDLVLQLSTLPHEMPPISAANVLTNCVPAVNLFSHSGDPIRLDYGRTRSRVRPEGKDSSHYEVYSVDAVTGVAQGRPQPIEYQPLFAFSRPDDPEAAFFRAQSVSSATLEGSDTEITFVTPGATRGEEGESISMELTCTNRQLPTRLGPGDLNVPDADGPQYVDYRNISTPTQSVAPPRGGGIYWGLLSHLSLNYLSLAKRENLEALLRLYNFRARSDRRAEQAMNRRMESLLSVRSSPMTRMYRGAPVRGIEVTVTLDEEGFGGEGEAWLFGTVLNEFLAQYVSLNAVSRLVMVCKKYGEEFTWTPRSGKRSIL